MQSTFIKKVSQEDCDSSDGDEINFAFNQNILDTLPATISVTDNQTCTKINLTIIDLKEAARGSFGVVYEGMLQNNIKVAIKKVLQDRKYKNRELNLMKSLNHNNVTTLLYFFYTVSTKETELYLNLIMDFIPQTLNIILKFYYRNKSFLPMNFVKIYIFQLFRGINYIHQLNICHRDLKPQNILLDPSKALLRICDFGSAKMLHNSESNVSYICSRYYRAPELIFGATNYTIAIDIWSAGCIFAEVLLNKPIFPGQTSVDQLVEIIKILGTPTKENVFNMNPEYTTYKLPIVKPCNLNEIFINLEVSEDAFSLLQLTFLYDPLSRVSALNALIHPFFDSLKDLNLISNSKQTYPSLYDFSEIELRNANEFTRKALINKRNI